MLQHNLSDILLALISNQTLEYRIKVLRLASAVREYHVSNNLDYFPVDNRLISYEGEIDLLHPLNDIEVFLSACLYDCSERLLQSEADNFEGISLLIQDITEEIADYLEMPPEEKMQHRIDLLLAGNLMQVAGASDR
jgi:hypothetical protein